MNTITIRQVITLVIVFQTLLLSGCLAKDKPDAGFVGNGPPQHNSPPTISGNPQTAVMMGNSYSFTPTASDPDEDQLTFSVENLPVWALFDASTGEVSGQPLLADVGVFQDLRITVSDGIDSASLAAFSVTVTQGALGSVTLSWTAPTQNVDGTALTDLAGYRFYYGTSSGSYTNQVQIDNPSINTYVIENLTPETYYIVATAIKRSGIESRYSNEAQIQAM